MTLTADKLNRFRRATARRLRLNATDAESRLWRELRRVSIPGTHFRRQVPIGPYVVDFACMATKLVLEVDGSQHATDENMARDRARTRWLETAGYRVIRFWNNDLTENMEGVLEAIYIAMDGARLSQTPAIKHKRRPRDEAKTFTPPRRALRARRPSPSRGG